MMLEGEWFRECPLGIWVWTRWICWSAKRLLSVSGTNVRMETCVVVAFGKPSHGTLTLHLYVANCGPAVGISWSAIKKAFETFGPVVNFREAGISGSRLYVS